MKTKRSLDDLKIYETDETEWLCKIVGHDKRYSFMRNGHVTSVGIELVARNTPGAESSVLLKTINTRFRETTGNIATTPEAMDQLAAAWLQWRFKQAEGQELYNRIPDEKTPGY